MALESLRDFGVFLTNTSHISGDGFFEANCFVAGRIESRFFVGAYSKIDAQVHCVNAFVGRFSLIERGCLIGYPKIRFGAFSHHPFARNIHFSAGDDYYKKIRAGRYYYEQNKYTFIGSDVVIGAGSVVDEGVVIGDGAIVCPNSHVVEDVPPFAVVSGAPATLISYRFDIDIIQALSRSKWWRHDISFVSSNFKGNLVDYCDGVFIANLINCAELPVLDKVVCHVNTISNIVEVNSARKMIVGPSHVDIWYSKYLRGEVPKPNSYHLFPITALSLFSDQLVNLIDWWSEWFGAVLLFVPDFRFGNVAAFSDEKDGRFVKHEAVSDENSRRCYELGVKRLDELASRGNVRFWFWCLNGREELNRAAGLYVGDGGYCHPLWNYSEMLERYRNSTIDVRDYFCAVSDFIVDKSIHPSDFCYAAMCDIFDELDW